MLSLLHIENVAVIERADIAFDEGLNLLTGETGAGKSIILDALGAVTGLRTSKEIVRAGAQWARVSAVFDRLPDSVYDFLRDGGVELPTGEELLIQRDVSCDGRNVCRVSSRPATVSLLRQLGAYLLRIHGQHDSQALLSEDSHGPMLDRFAGLDAPLADYRRAYDVWRGCEKRRRALQMDESEKTRRIDHLRYVCGEIDAAAPEPGEDDTLLSRRQLLRNAERLTEALGETNMWLLGGDDSEGARSQLSQAARALGTAASLYGELSPLHERLLELSYAADDISGDLAAALDGLDVSPGELDAVEARLDTLYRLKRKYGQTIEEVLAHGEACRAELDALRLSEETLTKLDAECREACDMAVALAGTLGAARREAAGKLAGRVREELCDLEMKQVKFEVAVSPREEEHNTLRGGALRGDGAEDIAFLLSANPGEPLRPLSRIASGGELSRVMLALCNVLSKDDEIAMVFDEIDAGVSGRAAGRVAEKLGRLSRHRQVLCVTHLPQIAAMADAHFRIEKGLSGDRAVTSVDRLDDAGRVDELSRLLGGLNVTETTRGNAKEQIKAAEQYKSGLSN